MYTDNVHQHLMALDAAIDSTGDKGDWAPGFFPVEIIAVFAIITNTIGATGVIKFDKRPTAGSDSSRGDGDIGILNLATTHDAGEVVYYELTSRIKVSPGEEIVVEVTDAAAASDTAHLGIVYVPAWEVPANNTDMIATT
jgi:hypothetical protein